MNDTPELELVVGAQPFGVSVVSHERGRSIHVRYRPYIGMYLLAGLGAVAVGLLGLVLFGAMGVREMWGAVVMGGAVVAWGIMAYYLLVASRGDLRLEDDVAIFKLGRARRLSCDHIGGVRCVVRPSGSRADGPARIHLDLQLDPTVLDSTSSQLKPHLAEGSDPAQPYYTALRLPCPDAGEARQVAAVLEKALVEIWESGDKSQKPKAKSQKPKAKSQKPKAKSQKPKAKS